MKLPRNLSAEALCKALQTLGYEQTRQSGSHIRLSTMKNGQHHLTIPNHTPIKIETLSAIFNDIAKHFQLSRKELLKKISFK